MTNQSKILTAAALVAFTVFCFGTIRAGFLEDSFMGWTIVSLLGLYVFKICGAALKELRDERTKPERDCKSAKEGQP